MFLKAMGKEKRCIERLFASQSKLNIRENIISEALIDPGLAY